MKKYKKNRKKIKGFQIPDHESIRKKNRKKIQKAVKQASKTLNKMLKLRRKEVELKLREAPVPRFPVGGPACKPRINFFDPNASLPTFKVDDIMKTELIFGKWNQSKPDQYKNKSADSESINPARLKRFCYIY